MKNIDVILFDLGGVLVELVGVPVLIDWTGNRYSEDELWRIWLESPAVRAYETGRISTDEFAQRLVDELGVTVGAGEFIQAFEQWPRGLFSGVPELLKTLQSSHRVACLSNTNELHWPRLMDEMGLDKLFHHHFASHLIGELKPDQACFEHVLAKLGCAAENVLFFDDNQINVDAGRNAGLQAELVKGPEDVQRYLQARLAT